MPRNMSPCIQAKSAGAANNTSDLVISFDSNVTAGNLIVVILSWQGVSLPTITVSDGSGSYSRCGSPLTIGANSAIAVYAMVNSSGGAVTITVHSASSLYKSIIIAEFPGTSTTAFDKNVSSSGTSAAPNTGSLAPTAAGDLLVAYVYNSSSVVTAAPKSLNLAYLPGITGGTFVDVGGAFTTAQNTASQSEAFLFSSSMAWVAGMISFTNMPSTSSGGGDTSFPVSGPIGVMAL